MGAIDNVKAFLRKVEWEGMKYYYTDYRDTKMCWKCFQDCVEHAEYMDLSGAESDIGYLEDAENYLWEIVNKGDKEHTRAVCQEMGENDRNEIDQEDNGEGEESCDSD